MEEQPKACPFCGWGTIVDEAFWLPNKHVCKCNACGARTRICRSWEDAVRLWNTRNRFLGGNPDRLKAIEDAVNEIANQRGW